MAVDTTLHQVLAHMREVLELAPPGGPGLTLAPEVFDVRALPQTARDRHFCLHPVSTTNRETYRGTELQRYRHDVRVRMLLTLKPDDQYISQLEAADLERNLLSAFAQRQGGAIGRVIRVSHVRTDRTKLDAFLFLEMRFDVEHDEAHYIAA